MTFTGDMFLHGSYGGDEGIPAGEGDFVEYRFHNYVTRVPSSFSFRMRVHSAYSQFMELFLLILTFTIKSLVMEKLLVF